jgi:hypothetical protein
MESLAPRLSGLLLLIMRRVYIGSDLQGPPEKIQSKTEWRRGDEKYALANDRGLFGGIADARNGTGAESV